MDFSHQKIQYKLNQQQTYRLQNSPTYNKYKEWLLENGVLTHSHILYPAYFGQVDCGVIGCATKQQIPHNQALIAVPHHLIINTSKVKQNAQLLKIIQQNQNLFGYNHEQQFAILVLYLCSEFAKQQQSCYYPYFQICNTTVIGAWSHWQMLAISNLEVMKLMKRQIQRKQAYCSVFLDIFKAYPHIFYNFSAQKYKEMVNKAYDIINTRSFGWPLKQRSLIPMADSLNHNNKNYVSHFMINFSQPKQQKQKHKYRHKVNFACLFPKQQKNTFLSERKKLSKIDRFVNNHKEFAQDIQKNNIQDKQAYIILQQYKKGRKLKHLRYYHESCDQDNDTNSDDQGQFQRRVKIQKKQQENQSQAKQTTNLSSEQILQLMRQRLINYWSLYVDPMFNKYLQPGRSKYICQSKQQSQQQQSSSEQESPSLSSTSSDESSNSEQNQHASKNQHKTQQSIINKQNNEYFIMSTRSSICKEQQIFTFYGRRNNRFLLAGYNFILSDNKYDSFAFRLNIQNWKLAEKPFQQQPIASKLIYRPTKNSKCMYTKQIRLKLCHLCPQLITHCRAILLPQYARSEITQNKNLNIFLPKSKNFQQQVLKFADQILQLLCKQFLTSRQQDEKLLSQLNKQVQTQNKQAKQMQNLGLSEVGNQYQLKTAIKLRLMYKNIIRKNREYVRLCLDYLGKFKNGRFDIRGEKQIREIQGIKSYLQDLQRSY